MKGTDRSVHVCPWRQISELQAGDSEVCPLHFAFFNTVLTVPIAKNLDSEGSERGDGVYTLIFDRSAKYTWQREDFIMSRRMFQAAILATFIAWVPLLAEDFSDFNGAPKWKVYDYNRSAKELRSRIPYNAQPGGIAFDFLYTPDTALLGTDHPGYKGSLLGDLTGETVSAKVGVTVTPGTVFNYYGEPSCGGTEANVRLFFETSTSGKFAETNYWWSNPIHLDLSALEALTLGDKTMTMTAPLDGSQWSDFYGHFGNDPAYSAAFAKAVKDVKFIGLSFGGGCYFENGVGIVAGTGTGSFRLVNFSVQ